MFHLMNMIYLLITAILGFLLKIIEPMNIISLLYIYLLNSQNIFFFFFLLFINILPIVSPSVWCAHSSA